MNKMITCVICLSSDDKISYRNGINGPVCDECYFKLNDACRTFKHPKKVIT
jgi:hypothetical protein